MSSVWDEIEQKLLSLYRLPHNVVELRGKGLSPEAAAQRKIAEMKSGLEVVTPEDFVGPRLFLRIVGPANRTFTGEWWFDAAILEGLEAAHSRVFFSAADKKRALRDVLREVLAISSEWNRMTEIWVLALPAGQTLRGYSGFGTPQRLFAGAPLTAKGNRMLVGKAKQVFFPVKNPLWVSRYQDL